MSKKDDWNSLVKVEDRHPTPKFNDRKKKPTHIILHMTGGVSFEDAKKSYCNPDKYTKGEKEGKYIDPRSAHYVIKRNGVIAQFILDSKKAWHSAIAGRYQKLYNKKDDQWKEYFDETIKIGEGEDTSYKIRLSYDKIKSPEKYKYFEERWGKDQKKPINYEKYKNPNDYTIGIEIIGVSLPFSRSDKDIIACASYNNDDIKRLGSLHDDFKQSIEEVGALRHTEEVYKSLAILLRDLSRKYDIPIDREHILGHEDVNPIGRCGWDPGKSFDWDRVFREVNLPLPFSVCFHRICVN